jgi:putative MATE family efflux protein
MSHIPADGRIDESRPATRVAMNDLTQGSITWHIVTMSLPMLAFMTVGVVYLFVDLYFVAELGEAAIAGVSVAANVTLVGSAVTQVLSVGAAALISQSTGRGDRTDANLAFNQSIVLSIVCGAVALLCGYAATPLYVASLTDDSAVAAAGVQYLQWLLPGLALQFAVSVIVAGLRGTGVMRPTMVVYFVTIIANIILAAVLVRGWLLHRPMGVAGAGLATSLSVLLGLVLLTSYLLRAECFIRFEWRSGIPDAQQWRRIARIGLPAGGEVALTFVSTAVIFWAIQRFGVAAQAGFGLGSRIMHILLLPAMAISLAVAPIAGQNLGAGDVVRVRQAFRAAAIFSIAVTAAAALVAQRHSAWIIGLFTAEAAVLAAGTSFLQLAFTGFLARSLVLTCTGIFQGVGCTVPSLASSAVAVAALGVAALYLVKSENVGIEAVWYLSVAAWTLQAASSTLLLRLNLDQLSHHRARLPKPTRLGEGSGAGL